MKNAFLTIKVEPELRERIEAMAKAERRSLADQTAYLAELGIKALERQIGPMYANREPVPMGEAAHG
jgi:predicted transcriptional regulator